MSLRHGPIPPGRRMFEVSAEETIALAQHSDLFCTLNREAESSLRQSGVSWTRLAFQKNTDRQHVIQQLPQEQSVAGRLDRAGSRSPLPADGGYRGLSTNRRS